jgi:Sec-independent protein secretion pathway component TatC
MLAVPLYLLYELGILAAGLFARPIRPQLAFQPTRDNEPEMAERNAEGADR